MEAAKLKRCIVVFATGMLLFSCGGERMDAPAWTPVAPARASVRKINYTVVAKHPHDVNAFTEGLLFHEGKLLESTGSPDNLPKTRSLFGVVDLATGKIDVKAELDRKQYFGEGIAVVDGRLFQVTWRSQRGFIYDATTFKLLDQFTFPNSEGWGLTTDGKSLIMSDGTYNLTWFDPKTLKVQKSVAVTKDGYGLDHLNELEWVNGYIYANVWMSNRIVKIDPETGVVVAEGDFTRLHEEASKAHPQLSEMNGIAYNPATGNLFITGKMWPWYYEVKLHDQ